MILLSAFYAIPPKFLLLAGGLAVVGIVVAVVVAIALSNRNPPR